MRSATLVDRIGISLETAIETLADVKASGQVLRRLNGVYESLVVIRGDFDRLVEREAITDGPVE